MRKFFVILLFSVFTFNVKAETIDFGDITAIDGTTPQEWLTNYVITGGEIRVAWASLPTDSLGGFYYYSVRYSNGMTNAWLQGNFSNTGYSLKGLFRAFHVAFEHYQELGYFPSEDIPALWPSSLFTDDTTFTISSMANSINFLQDGTGISSTTGTPSKMAVEKEASARNQSMLLEKVAPYQSIPINGLKIDVASGGSCTNCEVLLGSILTNMTTYTDYLLYMATNQTDNANVAYNLNHHDWTVDDKWSVITNLYSQQGLGNAAVQYDYFQRLELLLAALVYKPQNDYSDYLSTITNQLVGLEPIDYTDWWKMLESFRGSTNFESIVAIGNQYSYNYPNQASDGFLTRPEIRSLLGTQYADAYRSFLKGRYNDVLKWDTSWLTLLASAFDRDYYYQMGVDWQEYHRQTNIVDAVSLGRDWLSLATNDISNLPYWLNQQDYSFVGGTNTLTRYDVITNQYAHIGLTGSGQQANSAETWNYFKRLEMLLAALVYKHTDYEGKIDSHETGNNSSVANSVASAEDQINTSLSSVKDALTLNTLGSAKNTIVSLFQTATSAFDVEGSKRMINVMETDVASGNDGSSVTVNLDFTQGELGDFADFVHHLFGFMWGFGSLFIFWRVCKFCWDMGYKVVKFHYSLCRKFLGI